MPYINVLSAVDRSEGKWGAPYYGIIPAKNHPSQVRNYPAQESIAEPGFTESDSSPPRALQTRIVNCARKAHTEHDIEHDGTVLLHQYRHEGFLNS